MRERTTRGEDQSTTPRSNAPTRALAVDPFGRPGLEFKTHGDAVLERSVERARVFLASEKPLWLSLLGPSGTGKTFMAGLVFDALLAMRPELRRHADLISGAHTAFWPELVTRVRDGDYWRVNTLSEANIVFLDEIVVEHDPSGMIRDKLAELLTRRVGKWTILTSNLLMARLGEIDQRIPSRMVREGNIVVEMDTVDYALRDRR